MSKTLSSFANGSQPMPSPIASEIVNVLMTVEVPAASQALNDLVIMGELPEDCALVDAVYGFDDLDAHGTPTAAVAFGVVNDGETDLDTTIEAGITLPRTGGAARMTPTVAAMTVKTDGSGGKKVGFKFTTASATGAAGTVLLSMSYRSLTGKQ